MASKGLIRRRALFSSYTAQAQLMFQEELHGLFVCPICSDAFGAPSIEGENPQVNIAHVYPAATGGTAVTLLCKDCNSRSSPHDAVVKYATDFNHAMSGGPRSIRATIEVDGRTANIDFNSKPTGNPSESSINVRAKPRNPDDFKYLATRIAAGDFRFQIRYKGPDERSFQYSTLHSVHLAMFRAYGYSYYHAAPAKIFELLMMKELPDDVDLPCIWLRKNPGFPVVSAGFGLVNNLAGFWVVLPSPDPSHEVRMIGFPGLAELGAEHHRILLSLPSLPDGQILYSPAPPICSDAIVRQDLIANRIHVHWNNLAVKSGLIS